MSPLWLFALLALTHALPPATAPAVVDHALQVSLDPERGYLEVEDRVQLPAELASAPALRFWLNAALSPVLEGPSGAGLERLQESSPGTARYALSLPEGVRAFTLRYRGRLGAISSEGAFLNGAHAWYPQFEDELVRFSLEASLPPGWTAVSQGARRPGGHGITVRWDERQPQPTVYLVAGRFTVYRRDTGEIDALVYLRTPDAELAERYLEATVSYLDQYSRLIAPYPYAKFALVEHHQQIGYGMPSLTLIGSKVIRLPFIIHSSYPHEILHSWWGNTVYVDYERGNWSEGLTAYLADHRMQVQRGEGAEYRRSALQKYRNYVDHARDLALRDFRGGHDDATRAVGYNKALMMFHMLKRRLGEDAFFAGLRRFFHTHRFERASYDDLRAAFEVQSASALTGFFSQWVERIGAPALVLEDVRLEPAGDSYRIRGTLRQTQAGPPYRLRVPVTVTPRAGATAQRRELAMEGKVLALDLAVTRRPARLHVDPDFDLFRRLARAELPPALGELFGAGDAAAVLPARAPRALRDAYRELAGRLGADTIASDAVLGEPPPDRAVWLLGWDNRFRQRFETALAGRPITFSEDAAVIASRTLARAQGCIAVVGRDGARTLGWIGCPGREAIPALARKLPHYGKYSYVAFEGHGADNVLKGQWPVVDSPLTVRFQGHASGHHAR